MGANHREPGQAVYVELDWLETFLAVLDRGGFTAASLEIHRSQSRVSAHIAALERELGVPLIDRTRRPAAITPAGRAFASHAREILSGVGAARAAMGALRALDAETFTVLTVPCVSASLFPGVFAGLAKAYPSARFRTHERNGHDQPPAFGGADGVALAVLPALDRPLPAGLRERVLWREPLRAVVPDGHLLAHHVGPISAGQLARYPLVLTDSPSIDRSEVTVRLAELGLVVAPRALVGTVQTVAAMVLAGIGIGVVNAVALESVDTAGLTTLEIEDRTMVREVAVYWPDVLARTEVGLALLAAVVGAPLPRGALSLHGSSAQQPEPEPAELRQGQA